MRAEIKKPIAWISVACVILAGIFGWAAWNTLATAAALPETEFEEHEKDNNEKFFDLLEEIRKQREAIEDKLDEIQEKL